MKVKEFYPESLEQFISLTLRNNDGELTRLFRGQEHDWDLLPKIQRLAEEKRVNALKAEDKIFNNFKNQALIFHKDVIHYSELEKLTLAQHFGLPTRLLDWTTNPLIALWFACQTNKELKLRERVVYGYGLYDEEVSNINPKNPFSSRLIRFFKPSNIDQRISAQDSWFSIHPVQIKGRKFGNFKGDGLPKLSSEETFDNNSRYYFARFHISEDIKDQLLVKLNLIGINYRTLFPGLEGLCRQIDWESSLYELDDWL